MTRKATKTVALRLLSTLPVAACALFVNPRDYGGHCRFSGVTTSCGSCVSARCGSAVDGCCLDSSCNDIIQRIENCAAQHDETCAALRARTGSSDGAEAALATCIASSCVSVCSAHTGTSTTSCQDLDYGVSACTCTTATPPSDNECSVAVYPGDRCCASPAWPGPALSCTCLPLVCAPSSEGCLCNLNEYATTDSASTCMGAHCCTADDYCACRVRTCDPGETSVPSCSIDVVGCKAPSGRVDSCSIRVP